MESTVPERFETPRKYFWLLVVCTVFFSVLAASCLYFLLHGTPEEDSPYLFWVGLLFFSSLTVFAFRDVIRLPKSAVMVDMHGIWCAHLSRDTALVPWEQVYNVRDRLLLQRVELLSDAGKVLITFDHQVKEFERLRALVVARLEEREFLQDLPWAIRVPRGMLLFEVSAILISLVLLGAMIYLNFPIWMVILGGLYVALYLFGSLTSLRQLIIHPDHIEFRYPLRRPTYWQKSDVLGIDFEDKMNQGSRIPLLALRHENGKKVLVRGLEMGAMRLGSILNAWLEGRSADVTVATHADLTEA